MVNRNRVRNALLVLLVFPGLIVVTALATVALGLAPSSDAATLTVKVTDESQRPLRTCITVVSSAREISFCQSDESGVSVVRKLQPGSYRVVAKSAGFEMQKQQVELVRGGNSVSFVMKPRHN